MQQSRSTFSFRRRTSGLFGSRKSVASGAAQGAGAGAEAAPSVLFTAGALPEASRGRAPTAGVADPFLSALNQAEQRDLDSQRRLGATDAAPTKLISEEPRTAPNAPSSNASPKGARPSQRNLAAGTSSSLQAGKNKRMPSKAVVLSSQ